MLVIDYHFYLFAYLIFNPVHHCGASGSMLACHAVGQVWSPVRTGFLGEVFWSFSSRVRQMSGSFRPTRSPNIIWSSWSSFDIHLVRMNGCATGVYCLSCSCCLRGGPGIEIIIHVGRPCVVKKVFIWSIVNPSPDRSWLCKAWAAWVT